MRVFFAGLMHETNGFSPIPTGLRSFTEGDYWRPGDDPEGKRLEKQFIIGDMVRAIRSRGHELAFGLMTGATPSGPLVREAYETLRGELLEDLEAAGKVDAVFLFLHGAQFAEGYDDCEGDLLARVRATVGPEVPVGALLDLHGNIGPDMLKHADALVACLEYPHTDFVERGAELMALLERTARAEIKPRILARHVPMLGMFHTTREPMRSFVDEIKTLQRDGILSISLMHGFPWADLPITGANVLVCHEEDDEKSAQALADRLAERFFSYRDKGASPALSPAEAVRQAISAEAGPVVIADANDNPGGGAPGDSTYLLEELIRQGAMGVAITTVADPVAVDLCRLAGEGATLDLRIGGKCSRFSGTPVDARWKVLRIKEYEGGGPTKVLVESGDIRVILSTRREQVFTPEFFSDLGVDPRQEKILVVKSSQHFRAGFDPITTQVLYAHAPGCLNSDFAALPYQRLTRPIYPLDPLEKLPS